MFMVRKKIKKYLTAIVFLGLGFMSPMSAVFASSSTSIPKNVPSICSKEPLACNIYFEARGEPIKGQFGVGFVTITRTKTPAFKADTIPKVIFKKSQFSWVTEKGLKIRDQQSWNRAVFISSVMKLLSRNEALYRKLDPTKGAVYFHRKDLNISRDGSKAIVTYVGNHKFINPHPNQESSIEDITLKPYEGIIYAQLSKIINQ